MFGFVLLLSILKVILGIRISFERTMLVVEGFLKDLVRKLLKTSTFNRYGDRYGIIHKLINFNIQSISFLFIIWEKNFIERGTIQYINDITESFDDYFPCSSGKENCM